MFAQSVFRFLPTTCRLVSKYGCLTEIDVRRQKGCRCKISTRARRRHGAVYGTTTITGHDYDDHASSNRITSSTTKFIRLRRRNISAASMMVISFIDLNQSGFGAGTAAKTELLDCRIN